MASQVSEGVLTQPAGQVHSPTSSSHCMSHCMGSQEKCLFTCIRLTLSGEPYSQPLCFTIASQPRKRAQTLPLSFLCPCCCCSAYPPPSGPSAAAGVIAEGTSLPARRGCRIAASCSWALAAVLFSALPVVRIFYNFGCKASCIPLKSHRLDSAPLLIFVQCCLTMSFPF